MEDETLDAALQHAILALLDVKPKDPIKFLASHFQMECETNLVAKAVHLLQNMTIYHPAIEERLLKAYATISQYSEEDGLTGDIYTDLLVKLIMDLPLHQKDNFLQYLQCQSTEYVSFAVFRSGVLKSILFNQFVEEVKVLFSKLCTENHDSAPTFLCKKALRKISKCLSEASKRQVMGTDLPCTLGISDWGSPIRKTMQRNLPASDYVKLATFLSEAVEIFLREIPKK
ncbi:tubulin polyglutamylase complex subunit 1-like [Uloborus diversus]|uniref:tubulin polyglutamylase complex subunit 1-like n=1 Tax=Uloborus diversus TaxID=327109 RepID=UPI00240A79CA|nr:tubulin polyglutamylase complex subunit 1-like [Uloborus diversus]